MVPNGQAIGYNSRMTAQLALDASTRQPSTEKAKMLAGFAYNARDAELKQDRYDCAQRLYRFNKSAGEPSLLSEAFRRDQLRLVLESQLSASPNKRKSPSSRSEQASGSLGSNVEVEPPFFCDYGEWKHPTCVEPPTAAYGRPSACSVKGRIC